MFFVKHIMAHSNCQCKYLLFFFMKLPVQKLKQKKNTLLCKDKQTRVANSHEV